MIKHSIILLLLLNYSLLAQKVDTIFYVTNDHTYYDQAKKDSDFYEVIPAGSRRTRSGKVFNYYLSGELRGYYTYVNGLADGEFRILYKSGSIQSAGNYRNEQVIGVKQEWYRNKQMKAERIYSPKTEGPQGKVEIIMKSFWDSLGNQTVVKANGATETFHSNGSTKVKGNYVHGRKLGKWDAFYANGQKYYEEYYIENEGLMSGKMYDEDGRVYSYTTKDEEARFPGGSKAWDKFLRKNLRYPREAQDDGLEANVWANFIVDHDGKVSDVQVVKLLGHGFDRETLRALEKSPPWIPHMHRGMKVSSRVRLIIKFKLK